jgi:hypothetical protein
MIRVNLNNGYRERGPLENPESTGRDDVWCDWICTGKLNYARRHARGDKRDSLCG